MTPEELQRKISFEQTTLKEYEELLGWEKDPREKQRLQKEIEDTKIKILGLQASLQKSETAKPSTKDTPAPSHPRSPFPLHPRTPAPLPPPLIANAPYGLETELVGREKEIQLLDDWYDSDPAHPLLAIIGLGGQGKSVLTWEWLQQFIAPQMEQNAAESKWQQPDLIIWWSFYETDGSMDSLMNEVLRHFDDDPGQYSNLRAKVNSVINYFRTTSVLIMLDGAERLLRAYSGMGAAYQGDEEQRGMVRARECVDPVTGSLLGWLAQPGLTRAKTIVTSRLMPQELTGRVDWQLQGVQRHNLGGLSLTAATKMFHDLEIRASRAEVAAVCAPLGYHPLSLRLLARYVAYDPTQPNDLNAAVDYDPSADQLGKRLHVLQRAFDNLPRSAQLLLSRLAAFRSSVPWEVIAAVFGNKTEAAELYSSTLREDLRILELRGLLQRSRLRDQQTNDTQTTYDLHPIVRRYAYDQLADRQITHTQLVVYFEAVPTPQKVESIDDLQEMIELYHHLARAGRFDEARLLFRDRINQAAYFQLGASQLQIELLRVLFPDGEDNLPRLKDERAQAWTLNELANSYSLAGQPATAVPLVQQHNNISEKQDNKKNLAIGLGNLADDQIKIGALADAASNLRRSIDLCQEIEDRYREGVGHQGYGRLLAYNGRWSEAAAELDTALEQFIAENVIQSQCVVWIRRALAALLRGDPASAQTAAQQALHFAEEVARSRYPYERDFVRAYWLLGWSACALGQLVSAHNHLDTALRRCRGINMVDHEPAILLAHARLAKAQSAAAADEPARQQALAQSQALASEAQTIAERSGYVLDLADIHNHLTLLALEAGDLNTAQDHATRAQDYAWCDGPPHAYQPALDEAQRLQAEIKKQQEKQNNA